MTVVEMIRANFWKKMMVPPNRKTPEPSVVMAPEKMLTPIAEIDSVLLSYRDGVEQCT